VGLLGREYCRNKGNKKEFLSINLQFIIISLLYINQKNFLFFIAFYFTFLSENAFFWQATHFATVTKRAEFNGGVLKLMFASMA